MPPVGSFRPTSGFLHHTTLYGKPLAGEVTKKTIDRDQAKNAT
jgi:hypothetical protein